MSHKLKITSIDSLPWKAVSFQSPVVDDAQALGAGVRDRQDRVSGFDSDAAGRARVLLVGAGGLGGEVATGLTRKGYGTVVICDHDRVELSNLNRQQFGIKDIWKSKALCLAKNSAQQGCLGSRCIGHFTGFDESTAEILLKGIDVAVVGVDNNRCRRCASRLLRQKGIPAVFMAVNEQSNFGWCFVQAPQGPCVACVFPFMAAGDQYEPCTISPATINILRLVGGFALYAVDSLLMPLERHWNFREATLVGPSGDALYSIEQREGCRLCGGQQQV